MAEFGYNGEVNGRADYISSCFSAGVHGRSDAKSLARIRAVQASCDQDYQNEAQLCVSQPDLIRASAKDPDVHLYYSSLETGKQICVVVAPVDSDERFVVTAYLTNRVKQGIELWKK